MTAESSSVKPEAQEALRRLAAALQSAFGSADVPEDHLIAVLKDALATQRVVDDLAELYRADPRDVRETLGKAGISALPAATDATREIGPGGWAASTAGRFECHGIAISAAGPRLDEPFPVDEAVAGTLEQEWARYVATVCEPDPFLAFYRVGVGDYVERYRREYAARVDQFTEDRFGAGGPDHLVTIGIGANEQFWHYVQRVWARDGGRPQWHIADNPKDLARLPEECRIENTLFMEFSRSGKTQEVVKCHEFLPRAARRVVFANTGPLAELAERDPETSLRLPTEEHIPGRFGKNLSPMLLAPMEFLGLPSDAYWARIAECIAEWDLTDPASPPVALARYIRAAQLANGVNHIYCGANDETLLCSADELVQFWNEGVNKGANDITLSRYFGLPRDSHLNIEAVLANAATKLGLFVLRRSGDERFRHGLLDQPLDPINDAHRGLTVAGVDYALAKANAEHFATKMPTITIDLEDPALLDSATLSQLWTDLVYCYSVLIGVNPGSNPEVRLVRDRAEGLLGEYGWGEQ